MEDDLSLYLVELNCLPEETDALQYWHLKEAQCQYLEAGVGFGDSPFVPGIPEYEYEYFIKNTQQTCMIQSKSKKNNSKQ